MIPKGRIQNWNRNWHSTHSNCHFAIGCRELLRCLVFKKTILSYRRWICHTKEIDLQIRIQSESIYAGQSAEKSPAKRTYANYHGTELLKTFQLEDRDQLFQNETLHQLAYNIDTMMAEAKISDWRAVQISIFKMLNEEMVYGSDMLNDIKELYRQNKISRIIAVVVLIAIFRKPFLMYFVGWHPKILVKWFQPFKKLRFRCFTKLRKNKAECWHFIAFPIKLICLELGIFSLLLSAFRIITLIRF